MFIHELRLEIRAFIPRDPEPFKAFDDSLDGFLGRPLLIGVLNPQDQLPSSLLSEKPVEYGRPGTANMEVPCRTWRKARSYFGHEITPLRRKTRMAQQSVGEIKQWSVGVLEYWSVGVLEKNMKYRAILVLLFPLLHHSTTPLLP
jgi:hypothetical protein